MTNDVDKFWYFTGLILSTPLVNWLGLFLLAMFCWVLWKAQGNKNSPIDLSYVLVDGASGKVTLAKFGGLGAFIASTWVFIYLPVTGKFDTGYAAAYVAAWVVGKVATDFANRAEQGPPAAKHEKPKPKGGR